MTSDAGERKMRVLHLILNLGETNGQYNEHCLPMVGVRDLSICTYFETQLTPPPEIAIFEGDGSLIGFFRTLRRALSEGRYDVVHAHAPQTAVLVVLALTAMLRIGGLRSSLVYTVQDSWYDYKPRNQAMMVIALAGFKSIVFCSRAAYDSMPGIWQRLVHGRWRIVQNGADIDRVDRVLAAGPVVREESIFTVVSVGRLERVKDPGTLVEAFAMNTDEPSRLMLIGAGAIEDAVKAHTAELGLKDRVELTGLIPRDEVFLRCAGADVLVSTSLGEGLPVAVIEAMAAGCPVILSDIPPHRELADGANFIPLIAPGDTEGFAREMRRVRDLSPSEWSRLGRWSRDHVLARYTLPIMHAGIELVYRSLPHLAGSTHSR